jgi:hypothetical protein
MPTRLRSCPLGQRELIDQYFFEHRSKVLDLAAFLDRLDRARDLDAEDDFRLVALRETLRVLSEEPGPDRLERIQLILSDTRLELLDALDVKSAVGANGGRSREAR